MRKTLLKSLLVGAAMVTGATNVWADATSIYERGTTTAWSSSDIGEGAWSTPTSGTAEISSGLKYTSANNGSGSTTLSLPTEENSILVWSFTWNTGASTGRAGNRNYLKFGDVEVRALGQDQKSVIVIGGIETTIGTSKDDVRGDKVWTGTITINKATGSVSYDITLPASGQKTGTGTLASYDFNSVVLGFERGGRTNTSYSTLQAIEITEEKQSVTTADYTVRYMCGTTVVKDAVVRTGVVGDAITLTEADKADVYKDGKKYVYVSDDSESVTIDEGVTVTVNFSEAAKYSYTLNAVDADGNFLKELATGEQFEGDAQRVYYPRSFKMDGKWYSTAANGSYPSYGVDFTESTTKTVKYSEEDIAYFFEVNDFTAPNGFVAGAAYPDRFSNGNGARLGAARYAYSEPLEGGIYTITMWGRNQAGSSEANIQLIARDVDGNESDAVVFGENWAAGAQGAKVVEGVVIPVGSSLEVKNTSDEYNSNLEMDYVILVKTGEAPAVTKSVTLGESGLVTFASKNDLDFTGVEGLTAYIAPEGIAEGKIVLTEAKQVKGGQGMVLVGTANQTYSVPVTVGVAAPATNYLVGVTEDKDMTDVEAYILATDGKFHPVNGGTLKAGKAYLNIAPTAANSISVVFGDEATGIETVKSETVLNGDIFNLRGQRVAAPHKGLYIMQGKKVVVK